MSCRRIALFLCSVVLVACASSERVNSGIRTVSNPEALVGCTKIGILRVSADWLWWSDSVEYERRVQAKVTNLGGNTIVEGDIGAIHPYIEVWSCPGEDIVVPK